MKAPIRFLLIASVANITSTVLLHANEYWDRYSQEPVPIVQSGVNMTMANFRAFVDYNDEMLVLQMADGEGEISIPINDNITASLKLELQNIQEAYQFINQRLFDEAIVVMRPEIYPLIKFHQVPARFSDLHGPLTQMLEVLLHIQEFEEVEFILGKINLEKSIPDYSNISIRLMQTYLAREAYAKAVKVALTLPVQGIYQTNMNAISSMADQMRAAGRFEEVIPLYRRILSLLPKDQQGDIPIWLAYCLVLANQLDEVETMLKDIPQPISHLPQYSLYKLLEGSIQYKYENFGTALDILTKGFVRADPSYSWLPEMLFLIGDCYRMNDRFEAARNVWKELSILYPTSPWAEKANSSLDKLPPVEIREETSDA